MLILGICHRLLVDWVIPILAFLRVTACTRRGAAQHTSPSA